jgi:hypothetical protein
MNRRLLRTGALAAALALAATTVACRSKPADEQTLRDAGITTITTTTTTTTTGASTSAPSSTSRSAPDEDGPSTTDARRTTSTSATSTSTTVDDTDPSLPAQLTGDVAAACAALGKVVDLDAQSRRARPTSLEEIHAQLRATWPPTREAYTEVIAAVGADTPFGREFQNLRDNTDALTQAYLRAATLDEAQEVTTTYAEQVGEAAGSTFALNDPVKASCGFPLSAQLG